MKRRPPAPDEVTPDVVRAIRQMEVAMRRRSIMTKDPEARQASEDLQALLAEDRPDLEDAEAIYHRLPWRTA